MGLTRRITADSPVPDCECWFRVLTNLDHVRKDGRLSPQALKTKAFRPSEQRPWSHELSGRLRSLVADVVEEAETAVANARNALAAQGKPVPTKLRFAGVACARVVELRASSNNGIATDVIYTPLATDNAHADFVTYGTVSDENLDPIRTWLATTLRVIGPQDLK